MADLEQLVLSISADTRQMQRALDRLVGDTKKAADGVDAAFGGAAPKIDKVSQSLGKTRADTANLAAQFQDIAVQLQGGQSPFTIALQQGTQISAVLGQQGAAGAVGLLGTAFVSLLNPVSLATIATIALGGAAVQYITGAVGGVNNLDDLLKTHSQNIKALKEAWGEAGKGIETSVNESIKVLQVLNNLTTDQLRKQFQSLALDVSKSVTSISTVVDAIGNVTTIESTSSKFSKLSGAIDEFRATVSQGNPDVLALRKSLADIVETSTDETIKKQAQSLYDLSKNAASAQLAIEEGSKANRQFSSSAIDAAAAGEAFSKALKELSGTVTPDLTDRQRIMENYNKALTAAGSTEERLAAARARDDQLGVLSANERKKAAEDASKSAESAQKRFDNALGSTAKQTATAAAAAQALGLGAGALVQYETQAKLTEAAQQSLGKVTDETAAKIKAQAEAAGAAADALAKAKVASQIGFSGQTAFLSDEDVKIAQQLSSVYGNDVTAALNSTYAASIKLNDSLHTASSSISNNLTSGLTDIVSGAKTAKDGFRDMATSILRDLEQLAIKLLIVGPLMRSLQTGFNGLGLAAPTAASSIGNPLAIGGLFASGTNSAPGGLAIVGERGPELINLPRGSQVVPNNKAGGALGGNTVNNVFNVSGDVSQATIDRLQRAVIIANAKADGLSRAFTSTQRMQQTGVG